MREQIDLLLKYWARARNKGGGAGLGFRSNGAILAAMIETGGEVVRCTNHAGSDEGLAMTIEVLVFNLSDDLKAVVFVQYVNEWEGKAHAAKTCGVAQNTYYRRLDKARQQLQRELKA